MSGLRVTRVCITDVGVLRGRVDLGAFDPGITLITGGNETGKTTVVNALRCAFFERHGTNNATVRSLQPHGETTVGPEIEVDFELDGHRYELSKRFLKKAEAVLRIDGGTPLTGADADEKVWEVLGSSAPSTRGAKREDMGLWGVLWVSQDEAAFSDPSKDLGEETRGALQDAIGRQVGQIAGGRHGERLRAKVHEEYRRFWTAHGRPGGELKAAQTALAAAGDRVKIIEKAIHDVEDQAQRHAYLSARLDEIERERPKLEAELRQTEQAVAAVEQLQRGRERAEGDLAARIAQLETAAGRLQQRQALVEEVAAASAKVELAAGVLAELERTLEARVRVADEAAQALAVRERDAAEARAAARGAVETLKTAQAASAAVEAGQALKRAQSLVAEIEEVERQLAAALDDPAYERLRELERDRRAHQVGLEGEGSRFVVGGGDVRVAFGRTRTVEVDGHGEVTLVPGRPGLGAARDRLREADQALIHALEHHGIEDLDEARSRRGQRIEAEAALDALTREMDERSPDGAQALAEAVAADDAALERDRETLVLAEATGQRLSKLRESLGVMALDATTLERLEGLARDADIARARQDATGTGLQIHATRDIDVNVDDGPAEPLAAARSRTWTLTRPTRITLGDLAALDVTPGGEGVQEAGARREAADEALARALAAAGVEDMDGARAAGRAWVDAVAAIEAAEQSLRERAPAGLDELRESLRSREDDLQKRSKELATVRELQRRLGAIQDQLDANPITAAVLDELIRLVAELSSAHDAAQAVAAAIRIGDGDEQVVLERSTGAFDDGTAWELSPGEGGAEFDAALERAEQELTAALQRHGIEDLARAEESWRAGLAWSEKSSGLKNQLEGLAPGGLEALERVAGDAPAGLDAADLEVLTTAADTARGDDDDAAARLRAAREEADAARTSHGDFDREVSGQRERVQTLSEAQADVQARLETARAETDDDVLAAAHQQAVVDADAARAAVDTAAAAVQDASPELLEDDIERARASLEENRIRLLELSEERSAVKALLDRAAAEGRFEDLGEAAAGLDAARGQAARLQRTADGFKRLAEEVDRAYDAAQARFLAPVVEEARPYLGAIRPGTEIRMDPDLKLDGVVRRGTEESFDSLSGGTREQLSVIVRIALARVLARDAHSDPLPLVLDDTMGWTDDARFLHMTRILRNASSQFQIIVLTCHPERFARLQPGRTVDLEKAKREAVEGD